MSHQFASIRSYADVLTGPRDSAVVSDWHTSHNQQPLNNTSSTPIQRKTSLAVNASRFPGPNDRSYRKEPEGSTKTDDFWGSDFGTPMSRKSFHVIDNAVWGAINILLRALKSVPEDWPGLREIGMAGRNYVPLQGQRTNKFAFCCSPALQRWL